MGEDHREAMRMLARTLAEKAFYSYSSAPEGSFSLENRMAALLKADGHCALREERAVTHRFLMEYLIFRLFLIRYILKDYARKYDGLLPVFRELLTIEGNLLNLVREHCGGEGSFYAPLKDDWKVYMLCSMAGIYDRYEKMAGKNERKEKDYTLAFLHTVRDVLGTIREETGMGLYPDLFHFFMEESTGYANFLKDSFQRVLPEEIIYQDRSFTRNDFSRESVGACATEYKDLAYLTFALAGIVAVILANFGR